MDRIRIQCRVSVDTAERFEKLKKKYIVKTGEPVQNGEFLSKLVDSIEKHNFIDKVE